MGLPVLELLLLAGVLQAPAGGVVPPDTSPATARVAGRAVPSDLILDSAAVIAWRQFERLRVPATGLAKATFDYDKLTSWDMGSVLAATYSGRVLGFLDEEQYRERMGRLLATLDSVPLYKDSVFHKLYDANTGRMVGPDERTSARGYAWSATDLGRLLLWLRIVATTDSTLTDAATRVAGRMKLNRVVKNGYLHGESAPPGRRLHYFQEGRIGYEQYAARGFAVWGHDVGLALDVNTNAQPLTVYGVSLMRDARRLDRLTSEPFVLLGLEAGWTPDEAALARNVLEVQAQRYRRTGIVTIVSEDAVGVAPYYFYYYCVYCSGRAFVVETHEPGSRVSHPRWISTKATFGWHALLPSEYTRLALGKVMGARAAVGWSSGVMERGGAATRSYDINTAAVILEAAAYRRLGRPLLPASPTAPAR